jgi:hypothetical protein
MMDLEEFCNTECHAGGAASLEQLLNTTANLRRAHDPAPVTRPTDA